MFQAGDVQGKPSTLSPQRILQNQWFALGNKVDWKSHLAPARQWLIPCEFVPAGTVKLGVGTPEVTASEQSSCWGSSSKPTQGKNIVVPELFKGDNLLPLKMKSEYGTVSHFQKSI